MPFSVKDFWGLCYLFLLEKERRQRETHKNATLYRTWSREKLLGQCAHVCMLLLCMCAHACAISVHCTDMCMLHLCTCAHVCVPHLCMCADVLFCICVRVHMCVCCICAYKGQRLMPVIILGSSYTFFPEVGPLSKAQIYPVLLAAIATLLWVADVSVFLQRWSMPTRPQKQKKKLYYVKCCKKWKRLLIYISKIGLSPWLFM